LRLGCKPLRPCCKRIGWGEITRTHAPFNILRQLTQDLDLPFHLLQFDLGKMQGSNRFAKPPCQAQTLRLFSGLTPN
jgi:hypothetical protein